MTTDILKTITDVIEGEAQALLDYAQSAQDCARAAQAIFDANGPVIVSGIGKSGHIARKIASTFCSLGKRAVFLHASEASHGDLGLIEEGSIVLVLSNSGETPELSDLISFCGEYEVPIISITGRDDSHLAAASAVTVCYGAVQEACRNGLAPTTSTTLMLAIGDALAVGVSELMDMDVADFRRFHPGGKLGAQLTRVSALMRTGTDMPLVDHQASMAETLMTMSQKALGIAILIDGPSVQGVITDGDLRRHASDLWTIAPLDAATRSPVSIAPDMLVPAAIEVMTEKGISVCLVTSESGQLAGVVSLRDCLQLTR